MHRSDVVVIGAGMAGLTCALALVERGLEVVVLEAGDGVGGRIRTDRVDGMLLDRGFQLLNPAYPAFRGLVDLSALDLRSFDAGVVVARGDRRTTLADPLRSPRDVLRATDSSTGGLGEKAAFAAYALRCTLDTPARLRRRPDVGYGVALERARVTGELRHAVLEPFLAGVLAEDSQESSRRFVDLLLRMFARGTPALPAAGMQALPQQLADRLPPGTVHLESRVTAVSPGMASSADDWTARAIVVAADGGAAADLLSLPRPRINGLTTFYHRAETSPADRAMLHVDGDRRGPIVNTAVVSDAAPTYCRDGALIESTVLGDADDADTVAAVERQLAGIYGTPDEGWRLVATYPIPEALPAMLPPLTFRQPTDLGDGLFVCGDHRDTASIQGAIVSGRRAASAVARRLGLPPGAAAD